MTDLLTKEKNGGQTEPKDEESEKIERNTNIRESDLTKSTRSHNESIVLNTKPLRQSGDRKGKVLMRRKRSPPKAAKAIEKKEEIPLENPYMNKLDKKIQKQVTLTKTSIGDGRDVIFNGIQTQA